MNLNYKMMMKIATFGIYKDIAKKFHFDLYKIKDKKKELQ